MEIIMQYIELTMVSPMSNYLLYFQVHGQDMCDWMCVFVLRYGLSSVLCLARYKNKCLISRGVCGFMYAAGIS